MWQLSHHSGPQRPQFFWSVLRNQDLFHLWPPPIFEQAQGAYSSVFSPSELSDCMISLNHGPPVWAEAKGLHFLMQAKRIVASEDENALINVYNHQSKSYSSFNYNKDNVLLVVTFQIHCLLKKKIFSEGWGAPSNSTFPTAQQANPLTCWAFSSTGKAC